MLLLFAAVGGGGGSNLVLLCCARDRGGEVVKGQLCGVVSFLPPLRGFCGLNSGPQACVAAVLSTEPSCWVWFCCFCSFQA